MWIINHSLLEASKKIFVKVLSVDHRSGVLGKYFNFMRTSIPGLKVDGTLVLKAKNQRTGVLGEIKVWAASNGGSVGDAHGRWDAAPGPGQWETGDTVIVYVPEELGKKPRYSSLGITRK